MLLDFVSTLAVAAEQASSTAFPWLSASILFPIGAALCIPFIPDQGEGKQVRWFALGIALITFLLTVGGYLTGYDPSDPNLQLVERVSWLPELGLAWSVGADGICLLYTSPSPRDS